MHCILVLDAFNKPLCRSNIPFPRIPHNTRLSQNCVTTHNFKPRRLPVSLNGWVSLPPVTITPTRSLLPCTITSLRIRRVWEEFDPEVAKHSRHYGGGGVGGEGRILGLLECAERERGLLCHRKRKRLAGHEHFSAHSIAVTLFLWYCFYNTNTLIGMHWTGTTLWEDSTEWMGEVHDRDGESKILESSRCQSLFVEYCELHCSVCQPLSIKGLWKCLTRWSLTCRYPEVKRIRRSLSLENYDIRILQTLLNLSREYKDLVLTCVGCWTWI